jgi:tRNA-dihydrouridine synthase
MTSNFWQSLPRPIIGLAPMDGVTDAAFRGIVAAQGPPDVTITEFTSVIDVCRGPEHRLQPLRYHERERPVVAQLYGKDPDLFYRAAMVVCALGFDGLDLNMGCPSRTVASSGSGAGLIRTPELACAIIRAARQGILDWAGGRSLADAGLKPARQEQIAAMNARRGACNPVERRIIPLSVKTRIGYDRDIVESWIGLLLEESPTAIMLHGRTLEQMYRGAADWKAIERAAGLARGTRTLVLGNGDLSSPADVVRRVDTHGVHGVLVGRGALGTPWFFKGKEAIRAAVKTGGAPPELPGPSLHERFEVMLEHARLFESCFGGDRFPHIRKHLGWYCKGFPGAAAMRGRMVQAASSRDVARIVTEHLAGSPPTAVLGGHAMSEALLACGRSSRSA